MNKDLPPTYVEINEYQATVQAVHQSVVGIVSRDSWRSEFGCFIGTGTLVQYENRRGILTAYHVVKHASKEELRFFMPRAGIRWDEEPRVEISERVPLSIETVHNDPEKDVAFLQFSTDQEIDGFWTLRRLEGPTGEVPIGSRWLILGFPAAAGVRYEGVPGITANRRIEFLTVFDSRDVQGASFDSAIHVGLTYPSQGELDPGGFSGGGVWTKAIPRGDIWIPTPVMLGMVITHRPNQAILKAVKFETLRAFMKGLDSADSVPAEGLTDDKMRPSD